MKTGIDYIGITTPFYCFDKQNRLLLHKRAKHCRDEQGVWNAGAGQLDMGLTPEDNVLKETKEEYGCKGKIIQGLPAHSIFRTLEGQATHWLAVPFVVEVNPNDVVIGEPDKIDELGWFSLNSLPTPLHSGLHHGCVC